VVTSHTRAHAYGRDDIVSTRFTRPKQSTVLEDDRFDNSPMTVTFCSLNVRAHAIPILTGRQVDETLKSTLFPHRVHNVNLKRFSDRLV